MTRTLRITAMAIAMLTTGFAHSQISANFEPVNGATPFTSMTASCWQFNNAYWDNQSLMTGTGYSYLPPATNGSVSASINTPFLQFDSSVVTISFNYRIDRRLSVNASRSISFGTLTSFGLFTTLGTITLNSNDNTAMKTYSGSFTIPTGVRRISFQLSGSQDGNTYLLFDNISISAPLSNTPCNYVDPMGAILPLRLVDFSGQLASNKAELKWTVDENEAGDRIEMERSFDGKNFTTASVIFTSAKTGRETYSYRETMTQPIGYYRLKLINKNGVVTYSSVIKLSSSKDDKTPIKILSNPVASSLTAQFTTEASALYTVRVYNMAGVQILTTSRQLQKGVNSLMIELPAAMVTGAYVVEVSNSQERAATKFFKR